ncbi:hypothetical protein [Sphingomonas lenta]|uniref:TonB C-terminal domain-containing protein n=1 Tax=Sphingomonas lenta TaxID=1141887 RepID=A0A2A2SJH5_9SPHN|nr:hypothetical protein [Sphingomonas lenta]PAX09427.1 hypothetical protein CKY28_01340 [Sphingomonas lenta]
MTLLAVIALLQAAPAQAEGREVVVTARPLADTERAWLDCMARKCPPDQEIAAAVAHAENQFVAGDYKAARGTLLRTIGHVRGREREFPVEIGNIWRGKSRIDAHLGEGDRSRIAASESLLALKAGLPDDDPRVFAQRIELGDNLVQMGRFRQGLAIYEGVARRARSLDRPVFEGHALLRIASIWTGAAAGRVRSAAAEQEARRAIGELSRLTGPGVAAFREAAGLLEAKLAARNGDPAAIDRLIARLAARSSERPLLVYSPPIDPFAPGMAPVTVNGLQDPLTGVRSSTGPVRTDVFEKQWIDVGFRIAPDGTVKDAEMLRGSDELQPLWVEPVLRQVRGRRYAPLRTAGADAPGLFRVERVTFTSDYFVPTGTRIRMRSGEPRIIVTDLTADAPPSG